MARSSGTLSSFGVCSVSFYPFLLSLLALHSVLAVLPLYTTEFQVTEWVWGCTSVLEPLPFTSSQCTWKRPQYWSTFPLVTGQELNPGSQPAIASKVAARPTCLSCSDGWWTRFCCWLFSFFSGGLSRLNHLFSRNIQKCATRAGCGWSRARVPRLCIFVLSILRLSWQLLY